MLLQNYGWPTGPAKIWLWLARRPFGWPRATGKHDPCIGVFNNNTLKVYKLLPCQQNSNDKQ